MNTKEIARKKAGKLKDILFLFHDVAHFHFGQISLPCSTSRKGIGCGY